MGRAGRQKCEGGLGALVPTFAYETARADGNEGLANLVGLVELGLAGFSFFLGSCIRGGKICTKINEQALALIVFQFYLPPTRGGPQNVNEEQSTDDGNAAEQSNEVTLRSTGDEEHREAGGQNDERGTEIGLFQNEEERPDHQAERFEKVSWDGYLVRRAAEEIGLRENESQFGEFGRLRLKWSEIDPTSRAPTVGAADAG